ncbi:transposase [Shigella sp. FC569]|nr:transposase [Shigella sp. FC569]
MPCFTAMRAEIALMSGSAFAVTHHAFSSGAGRTSDGNGSHASTLKSPSYTKSVSWQHYLRNESKSPQQCAGVSVSAQPARSTLRDALQLRR